MAGKQAYRLFDITLTRRTQVSASLVRLTFTGPLVHQMDTYAPDQRIKLFFSRPGATLDALLELAEPPAKDWYDAYLALPDATRPFMRTYTIRALRREQSEVDVEFVLHGDSGPASRWATTARPGDRLAMVAPVFGAPPPHLGFEWKPPRGVKRLLLVADETAVPAVAGILETLEQQGNPVEVEALLEVPCHDDARTLSSQARLCWLARDTGARDHGELLLEALRQITLPTGIAAPAALEAPGDIDDHDSGDAPFWEPADTDDSAPFYAWIAAETKVAMRLRRYLVKERGLPKRYVASMGYWRLGKAST